MAGVTTAVWAALAGIFGLAIGSFLNVVIYRVPVGESVVSPPSKCPSCGSEIHNRHNIPVLGWLILRGRCFACHAPISPRYPIVEAATAALFAFYFGIVLAYPTGMGFGDVKLAGVLGGLLAYLSWSTLVVGAFAGFALGAIVGIAAM